MATSLPVKKPSWKSLAAASACSALVVVEWAVLAAGFFATLSWGAYPTITGLLIRHLRETSAASVGPKPLDCGRDALEGRLNVGLGGRVPE